MRRVRITALLGLAAVGATFSARADEVNAWPATVIQRDPSGETRSWSSLGPLLFSEPIAGPDAGHASGIRPFDVRMTGGDSVKTDILYPLFFSRRYPDNYKWSILNLINGEGIDARVTKAGGPTDRHFDLWPFYFSHETADPIDTYHALLPVYGTIKYRLGFDRLFWAPFPLYVQTEKKSTRTTYFPWPILSVVSGAANGFAVWPLYGATKGPGPLSNSFWLWPLGWNNTVAPKSGRPEDEAPGKQFGFLPFYTRETAPGYADANFLWPFFGYTDTTIPYRYSERRYFWPFLVQGHGDRRLVERWGPIYTHSNIKGTDSTWVMWPFWHRTTWDDGDVAQAKTQFFYFLYWSLDQTDPDRPSIAPAYKRHFWPLLSIWDNGAGSRQVEFISPFEVFFPDNPDMREVWTPLLSIYRYDRRPTGETRTSLLWNAITWRHDITGGLAELHVGPLFGMRRKPSGESWSILGFDLGSKRANMEQLTSR